MTAPANIRVNTQVPFPSLVLAGAPVTIAKNNGVWTVGFSIAKLGVQVPPAANYPNDYVLIWDSVAQTFFKASLTSIAGLTRLQRSITGAGQLPITGIDMILNLNAAADLAPPVPLAVTRNGVPLTFKNLPGSHVQTITATAPDTFDGEAQWPLQPGASVTLVPYNDGVNAGYGIE